MRSAWKEVLAEDFCDSVRDGTHDSPKETADTECKYLITSKHLNDYSLDFASAYKISIADYKKVIERSEVHQWDILFSMIGTIGKTYQEKNPAPDYAIKNVGLFKLGSNREKSTWLKYFLRTPKANAYIQSQLRGSTQSYVPLAALRKMPILCPPLPEQRAITATLSCLDDKIELNNKINANLEAQAQAIFKSWFVDFEPFQDGKFVDSELGRIPKGWRVGTVNDFSKEIVCGKTPSTKVPDYYGVGIPFITIPDMHGKVFTTESERSLSLAGEQSQQKKTVPPNSVCVSCIATTGLVTITPVRSQTNQQINTIICKTGASFTYVYLYMKTLSDHISVLASSGSATPNLNKKQFSKITVLIPSVKIMEQFHRVISPHFELIKRNQIESRALVALRDTLLPKLMSGEIEVPTAEKIISERS